MPFNLPKHDPFDPVIPRWCYDEDGWLDERKLHDFIVEQDAALKSLRIDTKARKYVFMPVTKL